MMDGEVLNQLVSAWQLPLRDWPQRYPGRQAMGVLCSYVPDEIVHAAGFTPVRVRTSTDPLRHVDAMLQSFVCALCRSTLDQWLAGDLGFLAGAVFAQSCDTMQAMADLWRIHGDPKRFIDVVMQPTNLGSPAARGYLAAELDRFRQRLAAYAGRPVTDSDLRHSIALHDETRRAIQALQWRRDRLSAAEFAAVLGVAQIMPREVFNALARDLLKELEDTAPRRDRPRLYLAGAVLDDLRILEVVDELGAQVAGDDLCTGSRHFFGQVGTLADPVGALVDYFLSRPPCPSKLHPEHEPGAHLLEQVRSVGADGVVFVLEKFCDPYAFERALARDALDRAGIPHLLLELEHSSSLEALRTRLQAFVEML